MCPRQTVQRTRQDRQHAMYVSVRSPHLNFPFVTAASKSSVPTAYSGSTVQADLYTLSCRNHLPRQTVQRTRRDRQHAMYASARSLRLNLSFATTASSSSAPIAYSGETVRRPAELHALPCRSRLPRQTVQETRRDRQHAMYVTARCSHLN